MCKLRPKSMDDEAIVSAAALWLVRMAVTKLRRPGERQYIIVKVSWLAALGARVSMAAVLSSRGSEYADQKQTYRYPRINSHLFSPLLQQGVAVDSTPQTDDVMVAVQISITLKCFSCGLGGSC